MNGTAAPPDDDAMALGMRLAQANAPAFVAATHQMAAAERIDFIRSFFCCLSGMAEQSIGYDASRDVLAFVAALKPVGQTRPLQ